MKMLGWLVLDRPERRNALTHAMMIELEHAFRALAPLVTNLTTIVNTVAFTSLGVATQKDKFRFALAEAALRGADIAMCASNTVDNIFFDVSNADFSIKVAGPERRRIS